ncbi:hypothetical protein QUF55_05920 [Clostridiaceae bacterium HSG29]|nr:hypothetical protein [Clostridiaceae bacterium HSG29]
MERKIVINKIKNRIRLSEKGTIFLILIPISFLGVLYTTFKKSESNIVIKLFLGVFLGVIVAFVMFYISTYIGMNSY